MDYLSSDQAKKCILLNLSLFVCLICLSCELPKKSSAYDKVLQIQTGAYISLAPNFETLLPTSTPAHLPSKLEPWV